MEWVTDWQTLLRILSDVGPPPPPPHIKPQPRTAIVALDPKPVPNPEIVFNRFFNHSSVNKTMKLNFSLISFTDTKCIMIKYKSLVVITCRGAP